MTPTLLVWNNIRPKLEVELANERERRDRAAYDERVNNRLDQLVAHFVAFFAQPIFATDLPLFPNARDARDLPIMLALARADDAEGDVSEDDFLEITDQVVEEVERYKVRAKRAAVRYLQHAFGRQIRRVVVLPARSRVSDVASDSGIEMASDDESGIETNVAAQQGQPSDNDDDAMTWPVR